MMYLPTSSSDEDSQTNSSRDSNSGDWPRPSSIDSSIHSSIPFDDSRSSAVKSAHLSNEYQRLHEFVLETDGEVLKDIILGKLSRKSSKHIIALGILFPRISCPPATHSHCVRCHKEYRPEDNTTCCIRHPNAHVQKLRQDDKGANFVCKICRLEFRLSRMFFYDEHVNGYYTGFCYTGKHTNDPRMVQYGGLAKTCEETGCIETYV